MLLFILRRILYMVPTLIIISIVGFIIIQAPPGDFVTSYVAGLEAQGELIEQDLIDSLRARYGLGEPIYVQYWRWVSNFVQGQLGYSMIYREPVLDIIMQRLPASFTITLFSLVLVYLIGVPIGILTATKQYSLTDYTFTIVGFLGVATPNFLFALVMLWLLFQWTGNVAMGLYSPEMQNAPMSIAKFFDLLGHIWIPAFIVGTAGTAELIRTMRANLLDELPKPYVNVARARGVRPTRLLYKYPLRIAINPVISTIGYTLPALVEGEVLVSLVLGLPTLAPVLLRSLLQQDMFLASSVIMILAVLVLVGTLISDILLAIVDPRIRESV
ncbi:MAG: ABC transporter permease [Chloroflexota bacterium]